MTPTYLTYYLAHCGQLFHTTVMILALVITNIPMCSEQRTQSPDPRNNGPRHSALGQVVLADASDWFVGEHIGRSLAAHIASDNRKKNGSPRERLITKCLKPTIAVSAGRIISTLQKRRLRLGSTKVHPTFWSEARDKSSKPRPAAQTHWLDLYCKKLSCCLFSLSWICICS
jgi:hypothetical protein